MAWAKLSVRGKIMGTIVFVSAVVLALGAWTTYDALRSGGRGLYLRMHYQRFERDLKHAGSAEYASVSVMARDASLIAALSAPPPPNPDSDTENAAPDVRGAALEQAQKRIADILLNTLAPEIFIISDGVGQTTQISGFKRFPDYRSTRIFQDLRGGKGIRGQLAVIDGVPYRISGAPVTNAEGQVLGTLLIGQNLERFFKDFASNSGTNDPLRQLRFALVAGDRVLASALNAEENAQLLQAIQKPRDISENVSGTAVTVSVLDFSSDLTFDFHKGDISGYRGADENAELGALYLLRTRWHRADGLEDNVLRIVLIFVLAAAIALVVGYFLAAQITRPLRRYIEVTGQLAQGEADLTTRLEVRTKDELGTLAENLNQVFSQIHDLAGNVQRSAFQVGASSGEISSISKQMLDGARHQAERISGSTAAVTELSSSIQQVAENAASVSRSAKQSGEAVHNAMGRLAQIRKTVEDAASRIETLGESGKRIANIVDVIRQISEQTTMLALNAAIEAAHAGEHGRGFAVVADEVSSLAKRVGQSAKDIEDLIGTIRDQTGEAVRVMQDGSREVEQGTDLVSSTLGDLQYLIKVIDDTAAAVQEQAIASDEIARNMDAVQQIAEQVLDSSQTAVATGERLHSLAGTLEQSVQGFKLDRDPSDDDQGGHLLTGGSGQLSHDKKARSPKLLGSKRA